jgi:hypothetical protein
MKAGTVSLCHYLNDHPAVFLGPGGRFGEPNYFIAEQNWPRGRDWYESLFDGADKAAKVGRSARAAAIGECSPSYSWARTFRGVPERMAQVIPQARLIYLVRDPIARMRSMYLHQVPRRQVRLDPHHRPDQRPGLYRFLTTRPARADDSVISRELCDRLAEQLAADQCRFEDLLGYRIPGHWGWSTHGRS